MSAQRATEAHEARRATVKLLAMSTSLESAESGHKAKSRPVDAAAASGEGLRNGQHILTSVLLILSLVSCVRMPINMALINLVLCALFTFLYFSAGGGRISWPDTARWAWVTALTAIWLLMMPVSDVGIYLILSLFFIYLDAFRGRAGVIAVIAATATAIALQIPHGLTLGGVLGPAISALVVVAIHLAYRRLAVVSQERHELIVELMATRTELAETQRAAGIAAERQRIAHEIHDTVAQGLSSIQMLLHAADRDLAATGLNPDEQQPVRTRIDQARRTAQDNLAEARAMIAALQPASLSQGTLEEALNRIAESFGASGDIAIDVDVEGETGAHELPMKIEAALLRIAQGAVGNVVKHAHATRARITLTLSPDVARLDVVDNGAGFDPEQVAARPAGLGHVGLDAMRRRAAELGGTLEVESSPGGGTAVAVAIPLDAAPERNQTRGTDDGGGAGVA